MKAEDHRAIGRKGRSFRTFLRDRKGAAALEFALLAIPFIILLTAILETTLIFTAQQVLQTATTQAARLIMTGQAQTKGMAASDFAKAVSANATYANGQSLFSPGGIVVNVQTFSSFGAIGTSSPPMTKGALDQTQATFTPGNPGDIELVQVYYQWPVITGLPGLTLASSGNTRLLQATAAFRNEPY